MPMKERLVPLENHRFCCTQCGECCRSRNVPLTMEDIKRMQSVRDPAEFIVIFGERKLVLDRREWDAGCVFLNDTSCTIQKEKPLICELYPVCISDKALLESAPTKLADSTDMYLYVDVSCEGVGKGELIDVEWVKERALRLRMQMLATDLGGLIGWYNDRENEQREDEDSNE